MYKRIFTKSIRNVSLAAASKEENLSRSPWIPVIGLEIHAQITSNTKLFSRSSVSHGAPPNTFVSPFDIAHPGTLPVINRRCVEAAVLTALGLHARINYVSHFDRKHYFYPDMPAGYQITQQRVPVAEQGRLSFLVLGDRHKPYIRTVALEKIQIEQDSGKTLHDRDNNRVVLDFNRAGLGLLELVFGPDLRNADEAASLVTHLRRTLLMLGVCSGRMNEGALRVDANVSVHKSGEPLGVRTEIKNINSIKYLTSAIEHEQQRQIEVLETGSDVINETRRYCHDTRTTISMRDKEGLQDYRFMAEPNLPPLRLYNTSEDRPPPTKGSVDVSVLQERLPILPDYSTQEMNTMIALLPAFWIQVVMHYPGMHKFFYRIIDVAKSSKHNESEYRQEVDKQESSPKNTKSQLNHQKIKPKSVEHKNQSKLQESSFQDMEPQLSQEETQQQQRSIHQEQEQQTTKSVDINIKDDNSKIRSSKLSGTKKNITGDEEDVMFPYIAAVRLVRHCVRRMDLQIDENTGYCQHLTPSDVWSVVQLLQRRLLHADDAAAVLRLMVKQRQIKGHADPPQQIASSKGWLLSTDQTVIADAVAAVIADNGELVAKYKQTRRNPKKQQRPLNKMMKRTEIQLNNSVDKNIYLPELIRALQEAIGDE